MKRILSVAALVCLFAISTFAGTIPITGVIRLANGNLFNGKIRFTLSYGAARDFNAGNVIVGQTFEFPVVNGSLPGGARITPNDTLQPAYTFYTAEYMSSFGQKLAQNVFYVTGTSFEISQATPTPLTTSNISFGNFTGLTDVTSRVINNVRMCDQFPGANAGAKIVNCIADLPSTGGTADARGFQGNQSITSTIVITKSRVRLLTDAAVFASNGLMIQVKADNVTIECSRGTTFNETGTADAIDIGDGGSFHNDNIVRGCTFAANPSAGSSINIRNSSNTILEANSIQNESTASIAMNVSGCNDCRILNNTVGSVAFQGIVLISSSNAALVKGNRVDCLSPAVGTGMIVSSQSLEIDGSNVIESCLLGMQIQAAASVSAYFENNGRSALVSNGAPSNVCICGARFFGPATGAADAVYVSVATNFTIANNYFAAGGAGYSNNAPVTIGANAVGGVVGPNNTFSTANEVTWLGGDIGYLQTDLVSEHQYFTPKNLAGNSFNVWPGGTTNSPPGNWILSGTNHARATDSPSGKYSEDLIGQVGIAFVAAPVISTTENAQLRGRYVSYTFWAKNISGSATSQLRLQINDGVTITNVDRTVTASWAQYTGVAQLGTGATAFSVVARNLNAASTLRVAGPSLYVGSTVKVGEFAAQQNAGLIANDQTDHALTGTTSITALTTVAMDANIMGNGGAMHVVISGTLTGTAGAKTIEIRPNSTVGAVMTTVTCDTSSAADWIMDLWIYNVNQSSQRINDVTYWKGTVNEADTKAAGFVTTSSAWTLGVYGTLGNSGDTITVKSVFIEAKNGMPD